MQRERKESETTTVPKIKISPKIISFILLGSELGVWFKVSVSVTQCSSLEITSLALSPQRVWSFLKSWKRINVFRLCVEIDVEKIS